MASEDRKQRRNRTRAEQKQDDAEATLVARLVAMFEDAEDATDEARKLSERDRDYRDNIQLTAHELQKLRDRGQPDTIFNLIGPKVDFLVGFEAQNRTDPKAFPRTPTDDGAAEAATDGLRFLKDKTGLDKVFSADWENVLVDGYAGHELIVEQNAEDGTSDFQVKHWPWDRLFYDPHSRAHDFSDATYLGGITWMDVEQAKQRWPERLAAFETTLDERTESETYDDRPRHKKWVIGKTRRRVRIVQIYWKDAEQWRWCIYTKGGKLEGGDVPFVDQDGKSWCPLLMESAYIDRKNNRYGAVRRLIGPQDAVNKRHSKALHLLQHMQTIGEEGAVEDIDHVKAEKAKPDGHIEVRPGYRFEFVDQSPQLQGHVLLLEKSEQMIDRLGPNSALLGEQEGAPSGRAILANQAGGAMEIGALLERHRALKERTYQRLWDLIRQYKNEEWWVRVTDDEKNVKFVGFNRQITMAEKLAERLESEGASQEEIEQHIAELQADPQEAATLQQVITENVPSQMHMDITIEEVPNVANLQQEQFDGLVRLGQAGVVFPPKVYIQASALRDKKALVEELDQSQANAQQQAIEMEALQKQFAEMDAKIAKLTAETEKTEAETIKTLVDADKADAEIGQIVQPEIVGAQNGQSQPAPGVEDVDSPLDGEIAAAFGQAQPLTVDDLDPGALEPQAPAADPLGALGPDPAI